MNFSQNFALEEFEHSDTAIEASIDNTMPEMYHPAAILLCTECLQPTRDHTGPIKVTSGYRCPELNQAVGGSSGSQHMHGEAADITVGLNEANRDLFEWMKENRQYDQLILEQGGKWIHVSYKETDNRQMDWESE